MDGLMLWVCGVLVSQSRIAKFPVAALFTTSSSTELVHLQEVVCYSLWLDLIVYHIAKVTPEYFENSDRYPYLAHRLETCFSENEIQLSEELGDTIYTVQVKSRIKNLTKAMGHGECLEFLETRQAARGYIDALRTQTTFVKDFKRLSTSTYAANTEGWERQCCVWRHPVSSDISQTRPKVYGYHANLCEDRLIFLIRVLRKLRESIGIVAKAGALDPSLSATLLVRLQIFDQDNTYATACSVIAWKLPWESFLVHPSSQQWW